MAILWVSVQHFTSNRHQESKNFKMFLYKLKPVSLAAFLFFGEDVNLCVFFLFRVNFRVFLKIHPDPIFLKNMYPDFLGFQ